MYPPLSIIHFNPDHPFTAEEHLKENNIILRDGDAFIALNRIKTLAQLMNNVKQFPIIDKETWDISYQTTMTLFYQTNEDLQLKQITFPYDPSVFNNYSIFHFIQMGSFPLDGKMYRLGDLRCFSEGSWIASSSLKTLFMGVIPMIDEVPDEVFNEVSDEVSDEVPDEMPINKTIHSRLSHIEEVNWNDNNWPEPSNSE